MPTDTSEKSLESLIVSDMLSTGWLAGDAKDYDRGYCVDLQHLGAFLESTQPEITTAFELAGDTPARAKWPNVLW
jgi:type I restriction enzyme R subunit